MTEVIIEILGGKGDGLAHVDGRAVHVPFALPGERVTIAGRDGTARLVQVIAQSPERIEPLCRHFGTCGGCRMQHASDMLYRDWKRELVVSALGRAGLEAPVAPLVPAQGAGRRRVVLHVRFDKGRALAGFMAAGSHDLIELDTCPVLAPALAAAPQLARQVVRPLRGLGKPLDVQITATDSGLDIDIRGAGKVDAPLRLVLSDLAGTLDLARLSVHGDLIVERRPPLLGMGRASVLPPPGGFLQATETGEAQIATLVEAALGKAKRVADLFAGCGPFALRLAATRPVSAFDSDRPAIEALLRAWRSTPGLRTIVAEIRDLFRRPLLKHELAAFDALVLDPPRAGAEGQVRQIALAKGPARIAYVSCDAGTFARDAAILVAAGWRLEQVTPVDQFLFTPHVELVGVFVR